VLWLPWQEKQAAVKQLESAAKAAAEERAAAAAQPLESSQRAVVRDLSAKVAAMTKELAQIKSERDVALVKTLIFSQPPGHQRDKGCGKCNDRGLHVACVLYAEVRNS
jgi:hypothetical protein